MNTDYRKLRQPRVIFTALSVTLVLLIAVFFLDRSHATHRWIRFGPLSIPAFGISEASRDLLPGMVSREKRRAPRSFGVNDPVRNAATGSRTVMLIWLWVGRRRSRIWAPPA